MNSDFHIESAVKHGDLHLRPKGTFDGNSAHELLNYIYERYKGKGRVFIDTRQLNRLCAFGCNTFRCGLNSQQLPADRLLFKGENGFNLAPNGCKVIVTAKKQPCTCQKKCQNCRCSTKTSNN